MNERLALRGYVVRGELLKVADQVIARTVPVYDSDRLETQNLTPCGRLERNTCVIALDDRIQLAGRYVYVLTPIGAGFIYAMFLEQSE